MSFREASVANFDIVIDFTCSLCRLPMYLDFLSAWITYEISRIWSVVRASLWESAQRFVMRPSLVVQVYWRINMPWLELPVFAISFRDVLGCPFFATILLDRQISRVWVFTFAVYFPFAILGFKFWYCYRQFARNIGITIPGFLVGLNYLWDLSILSVVRYSLWEPVQRIASNTYCTDLLA